MVSQRNPCFVLVFFLLCQNIDGQARAQNKTPCENCLLACKESSRPNAPLQSKKIGLIICESCVHNTTVCPVQELSRILFKYWKTESKPSLLNPNRERTTVLSTRQPENPSFGNTEKPCSNNERLINTLLRNTLKSLGQCSKNLTKTMSIVEKYQRNLETANAYSNRFVDVNYTQANLPGLNGNYANNEPSIRVSAGTELCPSTIKAYAPTFGIHKSGRQVEILQGTKTQVFYTRHCSNTKPSYPIGKIARCETVKNWHLAVIKVPNYDYDESIFTTCKQFGNVYKCLEWVGLDGHCSLIQY